MKKIAHIRFSILLAMLLIQSCSTVVVATPTLEQSSPVALTPTLEQPSPVLATPTTEILAPTSTPTPEPPVGFKQYQDTVVGVSVYIPKSWVVIEVDPGQLAYLQSYPENKYIGGEPFQQGDTKCDFYIRPPGASIAASIQEWKSGPFTTVISEIEIDLRDGRPGTRIEIESMGHSVSLFTEINKRVVVLACFGDISQFDEISVTLGLQE